MSNTELLDIKILYEHMALELSGVVRTLSIEG